MRGQEQELISDLLEGGTSREEADKPVGGDALGGGRP